VTLMFCHLNLFALLNLNSWSFQVNSFFSERALMELRVCPNYLT